MLDILELILIGLILLKLLKPSVGGSKNVQKVILDSSVLIDGRILELAKGGFLPEHVIIPEFILHELQLLADGADALKRERARYGLDVARELQDTRHVTVTINKEQAAENPKTADRLVALAKKTKALLYTADYNLAKVAAVEEVGAVNINELASSLRLVVLPGEERLVKIVQKGSSADQGIGYMEDGTMLVVEHGARFLDKTVKVSVTRLHQSASGNTIFAEIVAAPKSALKPASIRPQLRLKRYSHRTPKVVAKQKV